MSDSNISIIIITLKLYNINITKQVHTAGGYEIWPIRPDPSATITNLQISIYIYIYINFLV